MAAVTLASTPMDVVVTAELAAAAEDDKGVRTYYQSKIDELDLVIRERTQNLQRLKAQRNELNAKVRAPCCLSTLFSGCCGLSTVSIFHSSTGFSQ
jgi:hypothetical protein